MSHSGREFWGCSLIVLLIAIAAFIYSGALSSVKGAIIKHKVDKIYTAAMHRCAESEYKQQGMFGKCDHMLTLSKMYMTQEERDQIFKLSYEYYRVVKFSTVTDIGPKS